MPTYLDHTEELWRSRQMETARKRRMKPALTGRAAAKRLMGNCREELSKP
jgi:hypothetical protein